MTPTPPTTEVVDEKDKSFKNDKKDTLAAELAIANK